MCSDEIEWRTGKYEVAAEACIGTKFMTTLSETNRKSYRPLSVELTSVLGIVLLILISRLTIDEPNFKPVMALALLAGFLFHRQLLGLAPLFWVC